MLRRSVAILCLIPQAALAGCLSFLDPPLDSACTKSSSELGWRPGVGRLLERVKLPRLPYDRELYDSALTQGLAHRGDLRFELRAPGPHLVEIFLASYTDDQYSFTLEADGRAIDTRHQAFPQAARLRPRDGMRLISLLGIISGSFTVRTDSPRYFLSAVRWTPQKQFEENLAPAWLDRARQLVADPFFEDLRAARRASLEQLYDRLALSSRPEVRREAVIGQARAAYWLAAEGHEPRDIARADSVFREAFKLAPEDKALRQMISASCTERNVQSARMPYSAYCVDAAPVPWTVSVPPHPPGAPEWAVTQRRLAARLEAITRWWVERRQRANGELGGGWDGDVEMLRQWGPVALGLGSPVAAAGLRRLADGLWASGQLAGVERSSQAAADAQPLLAALLPEDAGVVARLRETAGQAFGPALWYACLTRDRSTIELLANRADAWMAARGSAEPGGSQEALASLLLALHDLTGEARYLEAAGESFQILNRCQDAAALCDEIRKAPQAFLEWRRRTGDPRYDAAFRYRDEPLPLEVLWDMTFAARESEAALSRDFDMYTSEVIYTDRVYYPVSPEYRQGLFGGEAPRGDRYPAFAVTWPPSETDFARAVLAFTSTSLQFRLYSFEPKAASAQVRLWRLEPGPYRWTATDPIGAELAAGDLVVSRRAQSFSFPLPPAREIDITLRRVTPLAPPGGVPRKVLLHGR